MGALINSVKNKIGYFMFKIRCRLDPLIRMQLADPLSIPVIIINFNQLHYLKLLLNFLIERGFKNIVVIDNKSSYAPLLEYYKTLPENVIVERMDQNYGHMVFFKNSNLQKKYGNGFYFLTDADIVPNPKLPNNFGEMMIRTLSKYFNSITKVGFALDIESIPDHYPNKQKVIKWEKEFWVNAEAENLFHSFIDTTFALYKPGYPSYYDNIKFYYALRMAGNFTAKHGGWYTDYDNLTDEERYYRETASSASSWLVDKDGKLNVLADKMYN